MIFKSDKVPKVSIVPFFYFLIIVLKLPVCFKLLYWKLPSLLLLSAVTLHLNRVLSTFSFTCLTIDAVVFDLFLLPVFVSLALDSYLAMEKFLTLGPSPSIMLYFQTGEGVSAKKTERLLGSCIITVSFLMNILCH